VVAAQSGPPEFEPMEINRPDLAAGLDPGGQRLQGVVDLLRRVSTQLFAELDGAQRLGVHDAERMTDRASCPAPFNRR
jgi:hypothetical protein